MFFVASLFLSTRGGIKTEVNINGRVYQTNWKHAVIGSLIVSFFLSGFVIGITFLILISCFA
jgi:hypothetical protein